MIQSDVTTGGAASPADTKQRILDAAERLFGEYGVAGTSLRTVIAEAGVNLAAVHYHFGSKEGLLESVVGRRIGPINAERLAILDRAELAAGGGAAPLEKIVEAFVAPMVRFSAHPEHGHNFMKLMGRLLSEPAYFFGRLAPGQFEQVRTRFLSAFGKALAGLPPEDLMWRLMFMLGAVAHALRVGEYMPGLSGGICRVPDPEETVRRLIDFLVAGCGAPAGGLR